MEARGYGVSKTRSPALEKMETLVRQMQSTDSGVPVRCQKLFLTTIPSAFMGYDLIEWLMENLPIDDSAEALHLASLLCQHGYFFPVGDAKTLQVKDDSSLYRFQTPYYWPSQNHVPDSTDYAIYLHKKIAKNKQKHGLEDCELEGYNQLKKTLASKWDFVTMQADEQLKMAKDRKKGDKIVSESQERAYWRVYRPPPGFTNTLELPPVPDRSRQPPGGAGSAATLSKELNFLQLSLGRLRVKISQVAESMITHHETYLELDPFLSPVQPSNPWFTDDPTFMELNEPLVEFPTERRIRRWALSMEETVSDPTGLHEFTACMRKEFSHENIRFWSSVHQLRKMPLSKVADEVLSIYDEFLKPGAPCEINIDGKTMERTQELLKNPTRFTYDYAADHIFVLLLKKDCYPRFLRSEHYKNLLTNATNPTSKKRFFTFGAPGKKKISSVTPPNISQLVASSGRLSSEDQSAVATSAAGGGAKPDCDPPYRKEEDAGIFLGGPVTPPAARAPPAPPALSPSPNPARPVSDVSTDVTSGSSTIASAPASAVVPSAVSDPVVVPAKGSAAVTAASFSSPAAAAVALSSASTAASTVAVSIPSSAASSTASTVPSSAAESSGLVAAAKGSGQGSGAVGVAAGAAAASTSASGASAGNGTSAGSAIGSATGSVDTAQGSSPNAAAGACSSVSAPPASPASAASTGAPTGAAAPAGACSAMPPVDPPPVMPASYAIPAAAGGSSAGEDASRKDADVPRLSEVGCSAGPQLEGPAIATDVVSRRDQVTASVSPLCAPVSTTGDGDSSGVWTAAIAPPAMFQDLAAPLATIEEREEPTPPPPAALSPTPEQRAAAATASAAEPDVASASAGTAAGPAAGVEPCVVASAVSATPHTEIVTLTDRCAQTVETGDSVDYGSTTDKQCEANLPRERGTQCEANLPRERGTRRKEKRVKICEAPAAAAASAAASATATDAATAEETAKRRSRSASADAKRERKESKSRREPRKKSSSDRRRARLEDGELDGASPRQSASPKRGDVVAPTTGEPAPQKLDESSVCPWENEENCRLDTPFVKTYATLGYL